MSNKTTDTPYIDHLSEVLDRLSISARVFYTGQICGISAFDEPTGYIHFLKSGVVNLESRSQAPIKLNKPTLVFSPRPTVHRFVTGSGEEAELVCASVEIGASASNPMTNALPEFVILPLDACPKLNKSIEWLFDEAFEEQQARQPMLNRLSEIVIIHVLRHVLDKGYVGQGLLKGLSHPYIGRLISALHQQPERNWTVEAMAGEAAMSRSKFAQIFKEMLGQTPLDYLSDWRINIAQNLLDKGHPVSWVANKVGYDNGSVLARVFKKKTGISPSQWQYSRKRRLAKS